MRTLQRNGRTYKIGIITVPSFYNDMEAASGGNANNRSTTHDVRRLLQQLTADGGVDALVLDLRGDGGGYLPEAIGLTHLFINHGPWCSCATPTGQLEVLDEPDPGPGLLPARWPCWWIAPAPRRPRSSPAPSRTITAA